MAGFVSRGRIALCARDVDVDRLVRHGGDHGTAGPGTPESVRAATDASAPAVSVVKKKLFVFVPFECSGEVPTGTDAGLASCGQGVDDAADDLPT
jgi:hypothetical protein